MTVKAERSPDCMDAPAGAEGGWLAVHTRARHERKVYDQLVQKSIEAFLPAMTRWSRWRARKVKIDWPLFPGYCFARVDPQRMLPVLTFDGVLQVVAFGAQPALVPDREINGIRQLLATQLQYDPCPFVQEGALVEVTHGPLAGVTGRLIKKGRDTRLVLAVELLGRALSVAVDAADVRPR
jgi:transcription antitermination factor NusG